MVRIVKTEFYKLKRYHILWAGVALMLLSVLLTLFTSMANDGSVWDFAYLTEQVIKNNMSMIFPMCISLIAGYMISREQTDDTLKNILTVPISFKKLLTGKLIVCGVLSIIFISCGSADYRSYLSEGGQLFSRCNHCFCLWIWRDVCRRKYDISKPLSDYRKSRNGRLP